MSIGASGLDIRGTGSKLAVVLDDLFVVGRVGPFAGLGFDGIAGADAVEADGQRGFGGAGLDQNVGRGIVFPLQIQVGPAYRGITAFGVTGNVHGMVAALDHGKTGIIDRVENGSRNQADAAADFLGHLARNDGSSRLETVFGIAFANRVMEGPYSPIGFDDAVVDLFACQPDVVVAFGSARGEFRGVLADQADYVRIERLVEAHLGGNLDAFDLDSGCRSRVGTITEQLVIELGDTGIDLGHSAFGIQFDHDFAVTLVLEANTLVSVGENGLGMFGDIGSGKLGIEVDDQGGFALIVGDDIGSHPGPQLGGIGAPGSIVIGELGSINDSGVHLVSGFLAFLGADLGVGFHNRLEELAVLDVLTRELLGKLLLQFLAIDHHAACAFGGTCRSVFDHKLGIREGFTQGQVDVGCQAFQGSFIELHGHVDLLTEEKHAQTIEGASPTRFESLMGQAFVVDMRLHGLPIGGPVVGLRGLLFNGQVARVNRVFGLLVHGIFGTVDSDVARRDEGFVFGLDGLGQFLFGHAPGLDVAHHDAAVNLAHARKRIDCAAQNHQGDDDDRGKGHLRLARNGGKESADCSNGSLQEVHDDGEQIVRPGITGSTAGGRTVILAVATGRASAVIPASGTRVVSRIGITLRTAATVLRSGYAAG